MGRDSVIREYKKVQAAKKAQERARFLEKTKQAMTVVADSANKNRKMLAKISEILQEEMTYTDNQGITRTVKGFNNDKANNTFGITDIFEAPEFLRKPFKEVSRNMHAQFKMFCITKGMTDEEILSLADENPAPETLNKMRGFKEEFFQMVTNKDMDKISDMYVGICDYFEKRLPLINKCTNPEGIINAIDYLTVIRGSGSYLQQTLSLNDLHKTEEQEKLIKSVNEKLAKNGKTYTLNDVEKTTMPTEYVAASLDKYTEFRNNPGVINKPELNFDFELVDIMKEDFEDEHFYENHMMQTLFKTLDITNKANEKAVKNNQNPLMTFSDVDNSVTVQKELTEDVFESVIDNAYSSEIDSLKVTDDLTNRLANHHRTNMWGKVKANTPEYNNVLNQMKEIQKLEHSYAEDKATSPKNIQAAYEKLIKVTQKYLDERDPNSPAGKERYSLMLETMDLAKSALEKYKNLSNLVEAENSLAREKVNCKEVEKEAVAENVVEQEKKEEKQVEEKKEPEKKADAKNKFKDDEAFKTLQEKVKKTLKYDSDEFVNKVTFSGRKNNFAGYVSLRDLNKRLDKIVDKNYSIDVVNEMEKVYEDITAGKTVWSVINSKPFQTVVQNNPFDNMDEKLKPIEELYNEYSAEANKEKTKVENKDKGANKEANKGVEL